ncbi:hypothetical protein [Propionivibrio sp.]|uniref:type II toxin-antitoxin system RelB family antitoxin n=1 Tax=Propionivibrio sp. TaxID=2212460 RepID=UPI003BF3DB5C
MSAHTIDTAMDRRMVEAAAYDKWFRSQVQAGIDDPRPSIPHEQVVAEFAERRTALRQTMS